jgi:hypothetical protein
MNMAKIRPPTRNPGVLPNPVPVVTSGRDA